MIIKSKEGYSLNNETFKCPVCDFNGLYFEAYNAVGYGSYEECPNCEFQFTFYNEKEIEKYQEKHKKIISRI